MQTAAIVAAIGFALTAIVCGLFGYVAYNNLRLSREIQVRIGFERRLTAVIDELNHRVKNILAVIQSIVTRTLRARLFYFQLMLAESAVLGAFLAQDLVLFVAVLGPDARALLLPDREAGGRSRPLHARARHDRAGHLHVVGSLLMLAGAVATGRARAQHQRRQLSTSPSRTLQHAPLPTGSQEWIFLLFAAAFLVKMPAFPLHGWMPDGYRAMPVEVLSVFSGVLSKVGAYGFLAIVLPLFPTRLASTSRR